MKIALTGTPGTGKSTVAEELVGRGYNVVDLNKVVFENKWDLGFDDEYQSTIADLAKLNAHIAEYPDEKAQIQFFEGHLAHLLDLDMVVVLRTHPDKLKSRLSKHKYPEEKVTENVEAEALAVITTEAMQRFNSVFEVDTTNRSVEETAEVIEQIIKNPEFAKDFEPGKFNWMEAIL